MKTNVVDSAGRPTSLASDLNLKSAQTELPGFNNNLTVIKPRAGTALDCKEKRFETTRNYNNLAFAEAKDPVDAPPLM